MSVTFDLTVQYSRDVDPLLVTQSLLSEWQAADHPPLLFFPRTGHAVIPDLDFLRKSFVFRGGSDVRINLKTSRSRTDIDKVELYFTNPNAQFTRPVNYCSISLTHIPNKNRFGDFSFQSLAHLFYQLVVAGPALSGTIDSPEVMFSPSPIWDICVEIAERRGDNSWPQPIFWMTYLSASSLSLAGGIDRLSAAGLRICSRDESRGVIVATGETFPLDTRWHIAELIRIMKFLEIIR